MAFKNELSSRTEVPLLMKLKEKLTLARNFYVLKLLACKNFSNKKNTQPYPASLNW